MDMITRFLEKPHFSFKVDGVMFNGFEAETQRTVKAFPVVDGVAKYEVTYIFACGMSVCEEVTVYGEFKAVRTLLHFENTAEVKSGQLSEIYDCDLSLPFNENYVWPRPGHRLTPENKARVFKFIGSNWVRDEYFEYPEYLAKGGRLSYACNEGRSSNGLMPYFEINENDRGALIAIGWSGQWNASFAGGDKEITVKTGIEGVDFYLEPREKIRTSSAVIMFYDDGRENACNQWRRFFKKHVTPMGKEGRPSEGPLSTFAWGAISSDAMIERIKKMKAYDLGVEYYWIDAGWYGYSTGPCPTEFDGDWHAHTGSWVVNTKWHPNGMLDVVKAARDNGMEVILWIEPERVIRDTDTPKAHPDWFLELAPDNKNLLLDLSNPEAVQGTYDMVAGYVESLGLKCYRQDFNVNPLAYWRKHDTEGRKGLKEIKCIMGLYRFWDMLLARFPGLFIDNCASGGRRNDIELMSRSMPLWRADYQCTFDYEAEAVQIHNTGISRWLPYHGTGLCQYIENDAYMFRSAYAPALLSRFWGYLNDTFDENDPKNAVAKKYFAEYKSVRPFLTCDYYALIKNSTCDTTWCAWQYHRPENGDGVILAFRRPDSPMPSVRLDPRGLTPGTYRFTDADTGEERTLKSTDLARDGLTITLPRKRSSALIRYHRH